MLTWQPNEDLFFTKTITMSYGIPHQRLIFTCFLCILSKKYVIHLIDSIYSMSMLTYQFLYNYFQLTKKGNIYGKKIKITQ